MNKNENPKRKRIIANVEAYPAGIDGFNSFLMTTTIPYTKPMKATMNPEIVANRSGFIEKFVNPLSHRLIILDNEYPDFPDNLSL